MKTKLLHTAVLTTLFLTSLGASAASSAQNDALAITDAHIGLSQAISAAEQHIGGKASRAEYEREQDRWVFDVEVVKGSEVMDVQVDPTSGKVLTAVNDKIDRSDDENHEDRGEARETDD